jgi:hypothetical protein
MIYPKLWGFRRCYLPSKWSGWTVRKRRERAKRPRSPTWEPPARPDVFLSRALRPCPRVMSVPRPRPLVPFGRGFFFAVGRSQIEPTAKLRNDTLLPFVSVGLRPWANLSNASLNEPISIAGDRCKEARAESADPVDRSVGGFVKWPRNIGNGSEGIIV